MVFLFSLSFIVAMFVAMLVIRGARGHAGRYGYAKPQRFHAGDVPRLGGLAIFAGLVCGLAAAVVAFYANNTGFLGINGLVMGTWVAVLLPTWAGGLVEDLTQRLSVLYRLVLTGLFVLAFIPQFVSASRGSVPVQMLVYGAIFAVCTAIIFTLMGAFASRLSAWLARHPRTGTGLNVGAGLVLVAAGLSILGLQRRV